MKRAGGSTDESQNPEKKQKVQELSFDLANKLAAGLSPSRDLSPDEISLHAIVDPVSDQCCQLVTLQHLVKLLEKVDDNVKLWFCNQENPPFTGITIAHFRSNYIVMIQCGIRLLVDRIDSPNGYFSVYLNSKALLRILRQVNSSCELHIVKLANHDGLHFEWFVPGFGSKAQRDHGWIAEQNEFVNDDEKLDEPMIVPDADLRPDVKIKLPAQCFIEMMDIAIKTATECKCAIPPLDIKFFRLRSVGGKQVLRWSWGFKCDSDSRCKSWHGFEKAQKAEKPRNYFYTDICNDEPLASALQNCVYTPSDVLFFTTISISTFLPLMTELKNTNIKLGFRLPTGMTMDYVGKAKQSPNAITVTTKLAADCKIVLSINANNVEDENQ